MRERDATRGREAEARQARSGSVHEYLSRTKAVPELCGGWRAVHVCAVPLMLCTCDARVCGAVRAYGAIRPYTHVRGHPVYMGVAAS